MNNPTTWTDPNGLWCVWDDGSHDDPPEDDGAGRMECIQQGGTWIDPVETTANVGSDGSSSVVTTGGGTGQDSASGGGGGQANPPNNTDCPGCPHAPPLTLPPRSLLMQINDNVWMQVIHGTWLIALADVVALGFFFKGLEQPWGLGNFLAMTVLQLAVGVVCLADGSVSNLAMGALYLALGVPYLLRIAVLRGDEWALPVLVIAVSVFIPLTVCTRRTDSRTRLAASLRPVVTLYALVCVAIVIWSAVNDTARHPRHPNRWLLGLLVGLITVEWIFMPKRGEKERGEQ